MAMVDVVSQLPKGGPTAQVRGLGPKVGGRIFVVTLLLKLLLLFCWSPCIIRQKPFGHRLYDRMAFDELRVGLYNSQVPSRQRQTGNGNCRNRL